MVRIKSIREGETMVPDPNNPMVVKGTIKNPIPYKYIDIVFDDDVRVQVERKQGDTKASIISKIKTKYQSRQIAPSVMGISVGDDVVV